MIPIVIISGFLGSGKTTFLQHILKEHTSKDKILIIENDFGETSLDAANLAKLQNRYDLHRAIRC